MLGSGGFRQRARSILVVDPNASICRSIARAFRQGFVVTTETSVAEARERVRAGERFDVVVAEAAMGNDFELFDALRTLDPDQANRMVLMSSERPSGAREEAFAVLGRWLIKPFTLVELRKAVRERITSGGRASHAPPLTP